MPLVKSKYVVSVVMLDNDISSRLTIDPWDATYEPNFTNMLRVCVFKDKNGVLKINHSKWLLA